MSRATDQICRVIDGLSEEDQRTLLSYLRQRLPLHPLEQEWGTRAEAILTAIARSSDLTLRGIRGILAEAIFEDSVVPPLEASGWRSVPIAGDHTYDFVLERAAIRIRVQVKLQRREAGIPKAYPPSRRASLNCPPGMIHVVEVQKTRSGERGGEKTRPYRFGDFDILAVNLHPSTGNWKSFLYTVDRWLLPRRQEEALIDVFQPVPTCRDDYWTDDLARCIEWFLAGERKRLYS